MKVVKLMLVAFFMLVFGCSPESKQSEMPLNKSIFIDEWYARATLIDKQSHSSFAFTGMECPVERIKFEITKDKLLAFRSYEKGRGQNSSTRNLSLVAAFSIIRHFGPSEDKKNRAWNELPFMEVDWSRNLAPHVECNQWLQAISAVNLDNNGIADPSDPYRVRMSDNYMETTVNALVEPDRISCNRIGDPDCLAASYRVKFSFRKINKNNDYEKRHYPDVDTISYGHNEKGVCLEGEEGCKDTRELWLYSDSQRQKAICDPLKDNISDCYPLNIKMNTQFGFFRTEIEDYDRQDGFNKGAREQLINRYNIWLKSIDRNGQSIPLSERIPKKIVYYLSPSFPRDLRPAMKRVQSEWNIALANIVAKLKDQCTVAKASAAVLKHGLKSRLLEHGIEAISEANLKESCRLIYEATKKKAESKIFFSGRPEEALEVYGNLFEIRINDCNIENLRKYQHEHGLKNALSDSGMKTLNEDNIEEACAILEIESKRAGFDAFAWQQPGDLRYSFINAHSKPEALGLLGYGPLGVDPKTGEIISASANIYLATITNYATKAVLLMEKMGILNKNITRIDEEDFLAEDLSSFSRFIDNAFQSMNKKNYLSPKKSLYQRDNLSKAISVKEFSSQVKNVNEVFHSDNSPSNKSDIDSIIAMVARGACENIKDKISPRKDNFFSERSACFMAGSAELPYFRLRDELKHLSIQEKIDFVKSRVLENVLLHEIGHTMGLRHNFEGAKDPLNYPPNFWGVNTNDYRDRKGLSEEELRSASIMDYHKNFNSDFSGLGLYDYAALLFGYGEKVEIFDEADSKFVPSSLVDRLKLMHYRDLPYLFSGQDAEHKINYHINETIDKYRRRDSSAYVDIGSLSLAYRPENLFKRKLIDFRLLKQNVLEKQFGTARLDFTVVPYRFCTDGQVDSTDIYCRPFTNGASASEVIVDAIKEYERAHALEAMGVQAFPSSVSMYLNHIYGKVYVPILRVYQKMYAENQSETAVYPAIHDLSLGSKRGLDLISRVLQNVEPGIYCRDELGDYVPLSNANHCETPIRIDAKMGHAYQSSFGEAINGSTRKVGFMYDKILALIALIDDQARIDHDFSQWQERNYSIGLYRIFTPQLINIFGSIYMDQWQNLAPTLTINSDKKLKLVYQDLFSEKSASKNPDHIKIKPSSSQIFKDYAILFSMAGLTNLSDHKLDFAERSHISLMGANTASMMDDSTEKIILGDPTTGLSYRAFVTGNRDLSLGYQLLKDAQHYISNGQGGESAGPWYVAKLKLKEANDKLETMRKNLSLSTLDITNQEKELAAAKMAFEEKNRILKEKIRTIDLVRALSNKLVN